MLPARRPQLDFIRAFIDGFGQAASAADFTHPSTGQHYSEFIDVDAWIDHHIINALTKNVDGLRFSAYFTRSAAAVWRRVRCGISIAAWARRTTRAPPSPRSGSRRGPMRPTTSTKGGGGSCFAIRTFKSRYRARFKALSERGILGRQPRSHRRRDGLRGRRRRGSQLPALDAVPAARHSHAAEIALLKDFLRRRVAWIKTELDTNF